MRPIELTRKVGGKQVPAFVNPEQIRYFHDSADGHETIVCLGNGLTIHVVEASEQIIGRLALNRSSVLAEERDGIEAYR